VVTHSQTNNETQQAILTNGIAIALEFSRENSVLQQIKEFHYDSDHKLNGYLFLLIDSYKIPSTAKDFI
jgi:hypothetical protein